MLKDSDILITGGYKIMGRHVAANLAPDYTRRVVVAAWSAEEAVQLAVELAHGVRERKVEVGDCKTYWPGCLIESACVGP
jgi:NAD(P)-dependent dehydrogenase (short-subunit alcohol dehydrogenase family)